VTFTSDGITSPGTPGQLMADEGIIQRGADILAREARTFRAGGDLDEAADVVRTLVEAADRVQRRHDFANGMGLAAPQIGIDRAAALVRPPGADPIVLLNPRVLRRCKFDDVRYEGCLSFFDVRGQVPRPRWFDLEYLTLDGTTVRRRFSNGVARLVMHEVDHLFGKLYVERMYPGLEPEPLHEYQKKKAAWYVTGWVAGPGRAGSPG
jgi:peptide deformylase